MSIPPAHKKKKSAKSVPRQILRLVGCVFKSSFCGGLLCAGVQGVDKTKSLNIDI